MQARSSRTRRLLLAAALPALWGGLVPGAHAWGDEGHEVTALIADHYLAPEVRARVAALLAGDQTHLTAGTQIDQEATWADRYRDSTPERARHTRNWHFIDIEIDGSPDLKRACFGEPVLWAGKPASRGPGKDCIVHKIDEFEAELRNPDTPVRERRLALLFLLHLIGDVHQPLHAGDDHDRGGNDKQVSGADLPANNLHHDWDTEFVARLGTSAPDLARRLIGTITPGQRSQWSGGNASSWALETYELAKTHAYGLLPRPDADGHYELSAAYVSDATAVTARQLSRAGVRLAFVLNQALQ